MKRLTRILAAGFFLLFVLSSADLFYVHFVKAPATPWTFSEFLRPLAWLVIGLSFLLQSRKPMGNE